jgi:nucleoside-triphosphatase THEP1
MKIRNAMLIVCAMMFGISAIAEEPVEWKHFNELFWKGTITDSQGRSFKAIIIPGFDNITKNAGEEWVDAGKTMGELGNKKFWNDRWSMMKDTFSMSGEMFTDYWYDGIRKDFNKTVKDNASIKPGEFGSMFMPIANWITYGLISVLGRTVTAPIGAVVVAAGGTVWTTGQIIWKPLEATFVGIGGGALIPGVLYVWNGFAWVGTTTTNIFSNVPSQESHFFHIIGKGKTGELVIDQQSFENIIHASTQRVLKDKDIAAIDKKIGDIEKEVEKVVAPYRAQQSTLRDEERKVEEHFNQDPVQKLLVDAINNAYSVEKVMLSPEAKDVYLNQEQLTALIIAYLKNLGIESPTQEMVDEVVNRINVTLERLRVEMAAEAKTPSP